jgi:hypothetical protein
MTLDYFAHCVSVSPRLDGQLASDDKLPSRQPMMNV